MYLCVGLMQFAEDRQTAFKAVHNYQPVVYFIRLAACSCTAHLCFPGAVSLCLTCSFPGLLCADLCCLFIFTCLSSVLTYLSLICPDLLPIFWLSNTSALFLPALVWLSVCSPMIKLPWASVSPVVLLPGLV